MSSSRPPIADDPVVAVLTVGSPQLAHAIASVKAQVPAVSHEIIENRQPFSAAFNHMLRTVSGEYAIQLDEDMELYPHACRLMLETFVERAREEPALTQMAFRLLDPLLGPILGVKIFHVERARRVEMRDVPMPDRDYNRRLAEAGLVTGVDDGAPVGHHARHRSDYELFLKNAVTASKTFGPGVVDPARSDLLRFATLLEHSLAAGPERALTLTGGLLWGLFNEVSTDVRTYPAAQFDRLAGIAARIGDVARERAVERVCRDVETSIRERAARHPEGTAYTRSRYLDSRSRQLLVRAVSHEGVRWDPIGFGDGALALALERLGALGAVRTDPRSVRTLEDPVAADVASGMTLDGADAPARGGAGEAGAIVASRVRMSVEEIEGVILGGYGAALVDTRRLASSCSAPERLHERLAAEGWTAAELAPWLIEYVRPASHGAPSPMERRESGPDRSESREP